MIDNRYVKELPEGLLDLEFFINLGNRWITSEWIDAPAPVALKYSDENPVMVDDYDYLKSFRSKHPNLKPFIKLMKIEPGLCPAHIDTQRECTLNIPVYNCNEGTLTRFYKNYTPVKEKWLESFGSHGPKKWYSNEYITYIEGGEVAYKFSLTRPALMDTQTPHDILNTTNDYRLIWSWTLDGSFEDAAKDLIYV